MIDYDLANKLNKAGFSFQITKGMVNDQVTYDRSIAYRIDGAEGIMNVPTLSELIEACPKTIQHKGDLMIQYGGDNEWVACYEEFDSRHLIHLGKTPEEAVARLWLSLNKPT